MAPNYGQVMQCGSGRSYTADGYGFIQFTVDALPKGDAVELLNMGCVPFTPLHIGHAMSADFNSTNDQHFEVAVPPGILFRVTRVTVVNASVPLSNAVGGLYVGPNKTGGTIVPATQSYAGVVDSRTALDLTLETPESTWVWNETDVPNFYLKLDTPQGSQATADVYVWGDVYWPRGSEPGEDIGLESGTGGFKAEDGSGKLGWG
jgi:hypothetical protein